jgi:GT2 family glycosyltransferase
VNSASRIGVIVLDCGHPLDAEAAAFSAQDPGLDVRVLIVENGVTASDRIAFQRLHLAENRGFAGGVNAGLARLSAEGCDLFLLLNDDALLEPGCLRRLAEALEDPTLAAVGPVILRSADGRVESRGMRVSLRWGHVWLDGHGEPPPDRENQVATSALSGAVMMLSRAALERVGWFDEDYFFSFEDLDWCLRARAAGLNVAVVLGAHARHVGSQTIGRHSPERVYYAARNHLRLAEKVLPLRGVARWQRRAVILALNLAHGLRQREVPRLKAVQAALAGFRDACAGRFGPYEVAGRREREGSALS